MRLIDADALKQKYFGRRGGLIHTSDIDNAPTIETESAKHGKWIRDEAETGVEAFGFKEMTVTGFICSICGASIDVSEGFFCYCPNCGAKMDEVKE
jgi:hypothetical protein